jgi:hypothetical protein
VHLPSLHAAQAGEPGRGGRGPAGAGAAGGLQLQQQQHAAALCGAGHPHLARHPQRPCAGGLAAGVAKPEPTAPRPPRRWALAATAAASTRPRRRTGPRGAPTSAANAPRMWPSCCCGCSCSRPTAPTASTATTPTVLLHEQLHRLAGNAAGVRGGAAAGGAARAASGEGLQNGCRPRWRAHRPGEQACREAGAGRPSRRRCNACAGWQSSPTLRGVALPARFGVASSAQAEPGRRSASCPASGKDLAAARRGFADLPATRPARCQNHALRQPCPTAMRLLLVEDDP